MPDAHDPDEPLTAGAIAASAICFLVGIPVCAVGVGRLYAVRGVGDPTLWGCLGFMLVGGLLCWAGMAFKGGPATGED